jgi:hypothetical protein
VKLLYTLALAVFPLAAPMAAPAPSPDLALLSALCQDDYYEDTAGQCAVISAAASATLEEVLEKYAAIITDDELAALLDDPEEMPVGSIRPRGESSTDAHAVATDGELRAQPAN